MKLTLAKSFKTGLFKEIGAPMRALMITHDLPKGAVWVVDDRKVANNDKALYLVVEARDQQMADDLRTIGFPIVALESGWLTYAGSNDHDAGRSFRIMGVRWEPAAYRNLDYLGAKVRTQLGVSIHGYSRDDYYTCHAELDPVTKFYNFGHKKFDIGMEGQYRDVPYLANCHLDIFPASGTYRLTPHARQSVLPDKKTLDTLAGVAFDGLRRATLNPKGEQ